MSRSREASAVSVAPTDAARPPWPPLRAAPLLPLALLAAAVVAALLADVVPVPAWFAALSLLLITAGALLSGACWSRQRQWDRLREARLHSQLLGQMMDQWQWQTDAEHRLTHLQPPQGAPASNWVDGTFSAQSLWQRFDDDGHSLQPRLQAHSPLAGMAVWQGLGAQRRPWVRQGQPRFDSRGRFAGYLGLARPHDAPTGSTDGGATAAADPGPAALAEEHAALTYTVSHDLRAPIRVVEGFGRILKEDHGAALDRVGNDHLDRILAAAARMNHMIDALLSLSRLSTQPLACHPVNLSMLAEHVVDELRRQSPGRQVQVHIAPEMRALGDPTLLRMALDNLLGNAWKYSARRELAQIDFECSEQDGRRVYVVRDNGAGFDMRFADRLFGVFQRLHGSTEFVGTGVGLASVRRIVRRHGGEIWAEAVVNQGASFHFTLGG